MVVLLCSLFGVSLVLGFLSGFFSSQLLLLATESYHKPSPAELTLDKKYCVSSAPLRKCDLPLVHTLEVNLFQDCD